MTDLELDEQLQHTMALVETDPHLAVQLTGQIIDLRNPSDVAQALGDLREAKRQLDGVIALLADVIRAESARQGTKTLHLEHGLTATVAGGTRPEYDLEVLADTLRAAGLPEDRLEALIRTEIRYRLDANVARQLRGANPAYAAALDACTTRVPAGWRVTIERKGH